MIEISTKEVGRCGWVSPNYTTSSHVTLDSRHLEKNRCVGSFSKESELACYKVLRTQLLQGLKENNHNVVMVTSARPGEGKTLTAINLSLTLAREFNQTVLLIDADLRHQKVHRYLGYQSDKGLLDHLVKGAPISELTVWPEIEKLTVISGGEGCPRDTSELLNSPPMQDLVKEVRGRYADRLVIVDLPAVLDGDDAIAFAPLADSIVFVVEAHRTQLSDITKALDMLPEGKLAGMVLNKFS